MLFNSPQFFIFFILVLILYFSWPGKSKWPPLLAASYFFYIQWEFRFAFLLFLSTAASYVSALMIEKSSNRGTKKIFLAISVAVNLGLLFFYKYLNFINDIAHSVLSFTSATYNMPHLDILLPVGISFYTLQAISYSADVYLEKQQAEKHPGIFALYLAFFPKLISGPIERASNLIPQLKAKHFMDKDKMISGVRLMLFGFFKKMVIADRLALYVDMVYGHPHDFTGLSLILATLFFTLQIYCDFSAYTDIAIGCGRIMGMELTQNFNFPYFAGSISDFWRRWHITLTSWFRDYVYIPLGGNRVKHLHWQLNIMIVFLLSGLWHGANWTFLCWGALHGLYYLVGKAGYHFRQYIVENLNLNKRFMKICRIIIVFTLVSIAWVFFRAASIADAFYIITHMFIGLSEPLRMGASEFTTTVTCFWAFVFCVMELARYMFRNYGLSFNSIPFAVNYAVYACILFSIFLFGVSTHKFIYFHF